MLTLELVSPEGKTYNLFQPGAQIGVPAGGLDLTAQLQRTTHEALSYPGSYEENVSFKEMTGSITFQLFAGNQDLETVYLDLCKAIRTNATSTLKAGVNSVVRTAEIKLSESLPTPDIVPALVNEMQLQPKIVSLSGAWWGPTQTATGTTTITNTGEVIIRTAIRWKGDGGTVTMPSGARFTLPPTTTERILQLSDDESCVITHPNGTPDRHLWEQMEGEVMPEPITPNDTATITVPPGATLEWHLGYTHPWG